MQKTRKTTILTAVSWFHFSHPGIRKHHLLLEGWSITIPRRGCNSLTIHGTGIFTYMTGCFEWLNMVNVGKYTIHGWYGTCNNPDFSEIQRWCFRNPAFTSGENGHVMPLFTGLYTLLVVRRISSINSIKKVYSNSLLGCPRKIVTG